MIDKKKLVTHIQDIIVSLLNNGENVIAGFLWRFLQDVRSGNFDISKVDANPKR